MLAYPTELLRQIYAMPLFPQSFLPFNLLLTLNAIRLNLEFTKAQRGADRPYLHVFPTADVFSYFLESSERHHSSLYEWTCGRSAVTADPGIYRL